MGLGLFTVNEELTNKLKNLTGSTFRFSQIEVDVEEHPYVYCSRNMDQIASKICSLRPQSQLILFSLILVEEDDLAYYDLRLGVGGVVNIRDVSEEMKTLAEKMLNKIHQIIYVVRAESGQDIHIIYTNTEVDDFLKKIPAAAREHNYKNNKPFNFFRELKLSWEKENYENN